MGCGDDYHCPVDGMPDTCGEALDAVRKHYGIEEIRDLARAAGISRGTLDGWKLRPSAKLNALGRDHLRRVLLGETVAHPAEPRSVTTADLAAKLDRVAGLLESLLTLDREGRLHATVKSKRGGGAA